MAMKPDLFVSRDEYGKRMDTLAQRVHACPTAEGFDEVIMPGERERLEMKHRRTGAPFHAREVALMQEAAAKAGLPPLPVSNAPLGYDWIMKIDDYEIDIVVQGFPGKSVCHGGLGWSTVVLVRAHRPLALIDTGNMSMRTMLIKRFAERGAKPADITELLLTHSHHDHHVSQGADRDRRDARRRARCDLRRGALLIRGPSCRSICCGSRLCGAS